MALLPAVRVELDEQTKNELQPPCDIEEHSAPAEWVLRWTQHCEHVHPPLLLCEVHADEVRNAAKGLGLVCCDCGAPCRLNSAERL